MWKSTTETEAMHAEEEVESEQRESSRIARWEHHPSVSFVKFIHLHIAQSTEDSSSTVSSAPLDLRSTAPHSLAAAEGAAPTTITTHNSRCCCSAQLNWLFVAIPSQQQLFCACNIPNGRTCNGVGSCDPKCVPWEWRGELPLSQGLP